MKRILCSGCGVLGLWLVLTAEPSWAQVPYARPGAYPTVRPTFSPYLNLLRGGSPTLNYYGLVRPEVDFRNSLGQLQQQVANNQQALTEGEGATPVAATGHPTNFLNYSRYFLNRGGQLPGATGRGPGTLYPATSTPGRGAPTAATTPGALRR
jgi:hypothetical protein